MAIQARKAEKEAILALIEGQVQIPDEDRAEWLKFAGQVLVLSHSLLSQREQWLIEHQLVEDGPSTLVGWFASSGDATKAAKILPGGTARAIRVYPWGDVADAQAAETEAYTRLFGDEECLDCHHFEWMHGAWRVEKGQLKKATTPASDRCGMGCPCKEFRREG